MTLTRPHLTILFGSFAIFTVAACSSDDAAGDGPLRCPPGTQAVDGECEPEDRVRPGDGGDAGDDVRSDVRDTGDGTTEPPDDVQDTNHEDVPSGAFCPDGAERCSDRDVPQRCVDGAFVDQTPCTSGQICLVGRCVDGARCTAGSVLGCASETEQLVCNDEGTRSEPRTCTEGPFCLRGVCGDQRCIPDTTRCQPDGYTVDICDASGTEYAVLEVCDRREQRVCEGGECVSGCVAAAKDPTYIGCEYWSVDLPQYDDPFTAGPEVPHAVVISNVSEFPATITVETRAAGVVAPGPVTVEPGAIAAIEFPQLEVNGTTRTNHSFRISTTEPVIAYQFNPLNNVGVASNDASLLLPASAIGREYVVLTWPGGGSDPFFGFEPQTSFFTVVATAAGTTTVEITFSCDIMDGDTITGIRRGNTRVFELEQWEVLNFEAASTVLPRPQIQDPTGTQIVASRPVVVFAGHQQAVIGEEGEDGSCCADHLEQQLFPVEAWGTRYFAVHSPPRGTEPDYWKVVASANGTQIFTTPPIPGLDGVTLNRGESVEVNTVESFEIESTQPILVGQFLVSQQTAGIATTIGDPAFALSVPTNQFRSDYQVLTPENYRRDYATVIRPVGARVTLNGANLDSSAFTSFGTRTHEFAHIPVESGAHSLDGDEPFAVVMYGYDNAVSYSYPGGLNVEPARPSDPFDD